MSDIVERRRARLSAELSDEHVDVFAGDASDDVLLDEITYAMWPPIHERRRPSYGAVVLRKDAVDMEDLGQPIPLDEGDLPRWRQYADGCATFLVRSAERERCLVAISRGDELGLVELARRAELAVVQRTDSGAVKVFCGDHLYVFEGGVWLAKPYAAVKAPEIARLVSAEHEEVLAQALDLCLHVLSPRHVGAILVWYFQEVPRQQRRAQLTRVGRRPAARLRIRDVAHKDALAIRLAQLDGACILDPEGGILWMGSHLSYSSKAERCVPAEGGTRHTSAKRFSFDEPLALVFVVSEDGLVRVYSDGVDVLCMDRTDARCGRIPVSCRAPDSVPADQFTTCERCDKPLYLEPSGPGDRDDPARGRCPVCRRCLPDEDALVSVLKVRTPAGVVRG